MSERAVYQPLDQQLPILHWNRYSLLTLGTQGEPPLVKVPGFVSQEEGDLDSLKSSKCTPLHT